LSLSKGVNVRKFLLIATVVSIGGVGAHLAGATPGAGIVAAPVHARATLGADLMVQVAPGDGAGLQWRGRGWKAGELPEFLKMLRDQGKVENLGEWVALHPAAAGKLGLPASRRIAAADFAVQQITIAPFGTTGWHTHPGPALVLVKSGELTLYEGKDSACRGTVYKAGQSFVDRGFGNVHVARNEGNGNVELWVMYLAPAPAGQPVRIDAAKPTGSNCTF
jgi:quercetin dioxygenase-like cupin family protein